MAEESTLLQIEEIQSILDEQRYSRGRTQRVVHRDRDECAELERQKRDFNREMDRKIQSLREDIENGDGHINQSKMYTHRLEEKLRRFQGLEFVPFYPLL